MSFVIIMILVSLQLIGGINLTVKAESNITQTWDGTVETITTTRKVDGKTYYEISNGKQLAYIAQTGGVWLNRNYILVNDIILNDIEMEYNNQGYLQTDPESLLEWKPIAEKDVSYTGIFDGNNHTISGIYINDMTKGERTTEQEIRGNGLFGNVSGTIKNLHVKNSYIKAYNFAGGIIGKVYKNPSEEEQIINCSFDGAVVGAYAVGGIASYCVGNISNCINKGNIYSISYVAEEDEEYNNEFKGDRVGGIIGQGYIDYEVDENLKIKNSRNEGKILANGYMIGGIIGYGGKGEISNCSNAGDILGQGYWTGGIYGAGTLNISNSYNTGDITGSYFVGGLVGDDGIDTELTISRCYNTGTIIGNASVGGLVGNNCQKIIECYNIGNVLGKDKDGSIGGIAGGNGNFEYTVIEKCYYLKDKTININESITGIGKKEYEEEQPDQKNKVEAKLKEFFPICLDSSADASYDNLGYEVEPVTLGDIDNNGKINPTDARKALLYYVGKEELTPSQLQAADVNGDGKVNPTDARQILLYYVGKISEF